MSAFEIVSPVDGRVFASRRYADPAVIDAAAQRAERAFPLWSSTSIAERCDLVDAFVKQLEARRDLIADAVTWQMGRPRTQADELGRLRAVTDATIRQTPDWLAPRRIDVGDGIVRYVTHDAIGPCLSICAWNYPVAMLATLIIHPLLAGNVVLLKHAPQTAVIGDFVNEAALAAGLPEGVLAALDMTHSDCEALIASGRFPLVQFIGSTRGGRAVAAAAGKAMARVGLELGGSDPAYIRHDANVDAIVADLVEGCFGNSGQSCCSVERLYVHASIHDRFVEALTQAAKVVSVGHSFESPGYIGPVISREAAARIRGLISDAVAHGARETLPVGTSSLASDTSAYVEPRILTKVDHGMRLMRHEVFGPVASIMKVDSDEQAIALMNDSDYGLSASIWSADVERAIALGQRVQSGTFYVNRCDHSDLNLPWGGVKQSGIGRSYALEGFAELTAPRAWHVRQPRG